MLQLPQQVPKSMLPPRLPLGVKGDPAGERVLYKMKQFAATRWYVLITEETLRSVWGPLSVGWTLLLHPKGWV